MLFSEARYRPSIEVVMKERTKTSIVFFLIQPLERTIQRERKRGKKSTEQHRAARSSAKKSSMKRRGAKRRFLNTVLTDNSLKLIRTKMDQKTRDKR